MNKLFGCQGEGRLTRLAMTDRCERWSKDYSFGGFRVKGTFQNLSNRSSTIRNNGRDRLLVCRSSTHAHTEWLNRKPTVAICSRRSAKLVDTKSQHLFGRSESLS